MITLTKEEITAKLEALRQYHIREEQHALNVRIRRVQPKSGTLRSCA